MTDSNASIDQNVASQIADVVSRHPDKPALVIERSGKHDSISFGDLWRDAAATAFSLRKLGLRPGDRVIVVLPMSIELYVCLLGLIKIGAVVVFIDSWIGAKQIVRFSEFAEPTAFIGTNKSHLLRWSSSPLRKVQISVTNGIRVGPFLARHSLARLRKGHPDPEIASVKPDQTALITFTGDSNGQPEAANRTHHCLLSQHLAFKKEFSYESTDVDLAMFPLLTLNNLLAGVTSIVPAIDFSTVTNVNGQRILAQMVHHGVTTCTASPPLLDKLAVALENSDQNTRSKFKLRRVSTHNAPVSDQQLEHWTRAFRTSSGQTEIIVTYGSNETEPVGQIPAAERLSMSSLGKGTCTGRPTNLIQTMIVPIKKGAINLTDRKLREIALAPGEIGELVVAGDHVCPDYYKNETATAANKLKDAHGTSWHRTGDTGYFDDQGRFWLVGRVDSTIIRDGQLVHPQVVEQIAASVCPEVNQVATVGFDDAELGELVVVVAYIKQLGHVRNVGKLFDNVDDIKIRIRNRLAKMNQPCDRVVLTDLELAVDPQNNSKIDYAKVKELLPDKLWPKT